MRSIGVASVLCVAGAFASLPSAQAADVAYGADPAYATAEVNDRQWTLTLGGYAMIQPEWAGSDDYEFGFRPLFRINRAYQLSEFRSFNDNASIALWDNGVFEAGITGKMNWKRDSSKSSALLGMNNIDYSYEAGAFVQWFPVDWLRLRGEVRYGFGGYEGVVADFAADAIHFSPELWGVTLSAGPRLTLASSGYIDTYFGVSPLEAAVATALGNPLSAYKAGGGIYSVGFGAQALKRFTENITGSVYAEYKYLLDDAADSPLVSQNGDRNQIVAGVSLSYTFFLGFE